MTDFFEYVIYNNTLAEWLVSLAIIAATFTGAKILYWISSNIIKKLIKKTKTNLDDLIIDRIEKPVILGFVLIGFWFGFTYLNLSAGVLDFVTKAFYIIVTFNVAWMIVRTSDALIVNYLANLLKKSNEEKDNQLILITRKSLKIVIWTIAGVVGLKNAGYDVGAIIAGLGLGGLAFALAAKDSLTNLFGGIAVITDKPFKINDRIQVDGFDGTVTDIGMRSTKLKTISGNRIVTIPNHKFTASYIENVSSEPSRRMSINLPLKYQTSHADMQKAMDILKEIDKNSPYTQESCIVFFESFGTYSLNINFIYYVKSEPDFWYIAPNFINMEILQQFKSAGIEFAFPTQTIITENTAH